MVEIRTQRRVFYEGPLSFCNSLYMRDIKLVLNMCSLNHSGTTIMANVKLAIKASTKLTQLAIIIPSPLADSGLGQIDN
jgi:hypothetical protein